MHSNPTIAHKVMAPKILGICPNRGTPLENIEGAKFSYFNMKNMFSGVICPAESESGLRKILKNFRKKLWAKKFWTKNFKPPQLFKTQVNPNMLYIFLTFKTCSTR